MWIDRKFLITLTVFIALLWSSVFAQQHWALIDTYPPGVKTCLSGLHDSIMFTATAEGIYRSGNYGEHWNRSLISSPVYNIYASNSGKILAGGIGKVFYSLDKGITWDSVSLNAESIVKEFIETSQGEFFLATVTLDYEGINGDGVWYSDGDLSHWEKRNTGLPFTANSCESIAIDKLDRIYVGVADPNVTGDAGLFISDDKGMHWQHIPLNVLDLGTTRIESMRSINITPDDSVIVSSEGAVTNYGYSLNLIKHRNDVVNTSGWRVMPVWDSNMWWMDQLLNKMHYSQNGDWHSSVTAGQVQGGTYKSTDKVKHWTKAYSGLGLAVTNRHEQQFFHETTDGRLFMVQHMDERMYIRTGIDRPFYTISGKIEDANGNAIEEVVVYGLGAAVFSKDDGKFALRVPETSTGPISFVKSNYSFFPEPILINNLSKDTSNIQVLAIPSGFHIVSGSVKTSDGSPVQNVRIEGSPDLVKTNEKGDFTVQLPTGWSGTLKPVEDRYEIRPIEWQIVNLQQDNLFRDFEAMLITDFIDEETQQVYTFPNPSSNGLFTLSASNANSVALSIWTCNGIKLYETKVNSSNWSEQWEAPEPGIYILKFQASTITQRHLRLVSYGR